MKSKLLGGINKIMKNIKMGMKVKRQLHEKIIVTTVTYRSELCTIMTKAQKVNIL